MKLVRVLVLFVALAAGGIAAYLALNLGGSPVTTVVELAPQIQSQDVLVAAADVGQGQAVTAENMRWQRWPDEAMNPAYIQKQARPDALEKLAGSVVRNQFSAGEPIRESKLARPESGFLSAILPSGKRAIAVRVSAQNTAGGFILPNDRVDVVQTITQQASPEAPPTNVSRTLLTNVKVLAVDQTIEEQNGEAVVVGKTVTLELDPPQVELITAAEAAGQIALSLRSFADAGEATVAFSPPPPPPTLEPTAAPPPAVVEKPKPGTVRIFRNGRMQELSIGLPSDDAPQSSLDAPPSAPASPQSNLGELPSYEPEAHCTAVAKAGGGYSESTYSDCLAQEEAEQDQLKSDWAALPQAIRDRCNAVASAGATASYSLLSGCVTQEQTALQDDQVGSSRTSSVR